MGTIEWERAAWVTGAIFAVAVLWLLAFAYYFGQWMPPGAAAAVQAVGSLVGIGLAIYVPYRQYKDRVEQAHFDAIDRATAIVKLLEGDILSLTLHCAVAIRVIEDDDQSALLGGRRVDLLNQLLLRISTQYQTLSPEIVRADIDHLTPLLNLIKAGEYHNGLLMSHANGAATLSKDDWVQVLVIVSQNLKFTWRAAQRAWLAYMDQPMPTLETVPGHTASPR